MRTESPRTRILHLVRQAARWRPRNDRQIWLIVSSLVIVVCAEAMVIPAKRRGPASPATTSPPTSSAWLWPARRSVRSSATGNWRAWSWRRPRASSTAS